MWVRERRGYLKTQVKLDKSFWRTIARKTEEHENISHLEDCHGNKLTWEHFRCTFNQMIFSCFPPSLHLFFWSNCFCRIFGAKNIFHGREGERLNVKGCCFYLDFYTRTMRLEKHPILTSGHQHSIHFLLSATQRRLFPSLSLQKKVNKSILLLKSIDRDFVTFLNKRGWRRRRKISKIENLM